MSTKTAIENLPTPTLIGVVHLPALPGTARHSLGMDDIIEIAVSDAVALEVAGFDALIVENYGDIPFVREALPPASLAAMAIAADRIRRACPLPLGINALRNDARGAMGIAAACGADFVRVNVHTGVAATDQGIIEGRACETLAYRRQLGANVAICADVHVKHASPVHELNIARCAQDTAYRGLADGLIVTGPATGQPVDMDQLRKVREAVPDRRLYVGSGVTLDTVVPICALVDGVIVGTAIKHDQQTHNQVSPDTAKAFVSRVRMRENV